jgi:ribosome-binding protein aMBF1 (putative translation factor)
MRDGQQEQTSKGRNDDVSTTRNQEQRTSVKRALAQPRETKLRERNKRIGELLMQARRRQGISISKCADLISTSRRRYTFMEQGDAVIGAVELDELTRFLEIRDELRTLLNETMSMEDDSNSQQPEKVGCHILSEALQAGHVVQLVVVGQGTYTLESAINPKHRTDES